MAKRRGAAFDLDGTLVDTSADLIAAANATLATGGCAGRLDPAADAGIAGRGGRAMLRLGWARAGLSEAAAEAAAEPLYLPFIDAYTDRIAVESRLFDGVEAALDALAEGGWALSVCTNKPERLALILLDALGVLDRFACVIGADTLPVRKPDPAPLLAAWAGSGADAAVSALIGDTRTDRETARAAAAPCVLMDMGVSADDPHGLEAHAVLAEYASLPAVLERLIPASLAV